MSFPIARLRRTRLGATLVEYALLLGLIAIIVMSVLLVLGPTIASSFQNTASHAGGAGTPGGPSGPGGGGGGASDFELSATIWNETVSGTNKELMLGIQTDSVDGDPYTATISSESGAVLGTATLTDEGAEWGFPNGFASGNTTVLVPCEEVVGGSYLTVDAVGQDGSEASTNVAFLDCDTAPASASLFISDITYNGDTTWTITFDAEAIGGDINNTGPFDFVFLDYDFQPLPAISNPDRTLSGTTTLPGADSDPTDCNTISWVNLVIYNDDGSQFASAGASAPCPPPDDDGGGDLPPDDGGGTGHTGTASFSFDGHAPDGGGLEVFSYTVSYDAAASEVQYAELLHTGGQVPMAVDNSQGDPFGGSSTHTVSIDCSHYHPELGDYTEVTLTLRYLDGMADSQSFTFTGCD